MLSARLAEVFDLLRHRAHLALTGARADDDVVTHLAATAHIEKQHIAAFRVGDGARDVERKLKRRFWISGGT